jgi:hypothetical protein
MDFIDPALDFINPACPPIPTLDELLDSGDFIEVDVNDLVQGDFVILTHLDNTRCIEVLANDDPVGYIIYRFYNALVGTTAQSLKRSLIRSGVRFYRKKNPRKVYDDVVNEIRSYPVNKNLNRVQTVITIPGVAETVGDFLGGPNSLRNPYINPYKKRRLIKRAGTRRKTRKTKRKSTRRIRKK